MGTEHARKTNRLRPCHHADPTRAQATVARGPDGGGASSSQDAQPPAPAAGSLNSAESSIEEIEARLVRAAVQQGKVGGLGEAG